MIHAMCKLNALHGAKLFVRACMHAEGGQVGIEPTTSRTQIENHTTRPLTHSLYVMITLLRAPRIELGTYCVLSSRHNQLDQARI